MQTSNFEKLFFPTMADILGAYLTFYLVSNYQSIVFQLQVHPSLFGLLIIDLNL